MATIINYKAMDNAFINRLMGICNEFSNDEVIQRIIKNAREVRNHPTSHAWINLAQSLVLIEMEYGNNVGDLIRYAENRGRGM